MDPVETVTKADLDEAIYYCNTILQQCSSNQDDATDFWYILNTLKIKNLCHGLQQVKFQNHQSETRGRM